MGNPSRAIPMMCEGPAAVSTCDVTQDGLPCACQVVPFECELHWSRNQAVCWVPLPSVKV